MTIHMIHMIHMVTSVEPLATNLVESNLMSLFVCSGELVRSVFDVVFSCMIFWYVTVHCIVLYVCL